MHDAVNTLIHKPTLVVAIQDAEVAVAGRLIAAQILGVRQAAPDEVQLQAQLRQKAGLTVGRAGCRW